MKFTVGLILVIGCIFGGYVGAHGKLISLWQPFELIIIGGGAFGAFIVANPGHVISAVFKDSFGLFKGSK